MRDKKDNATLDLVGFDHDSLASIAIPEPGATPVATAAAAGPKRTIRPRAPALQQHQLELLDATDASGLPVWQRDEGLDLTGLPIWAAA
ncbi:MAG: hypothetical protein JWP59_1862 [Massilia sp.]|nr:hypothetical protein [Massilia sp.]